MRAVEFDLISTLLVAMVVLFVSRRAEGAPGRGEAIFREGAFRQQGLSVYALHHPAPLQPTRTVLHEDVAAERDRTGPMRALFAACRNKELRVDVSPLKQVEL